MDRRTHEGHMDWEYQNQGPVDPTSPFAQAARTGALNNGFGSPVKNNIFARPNLPSTPTRFQPPARNTLFSSQQAPTAPPFMNPSFTTPRKPYDDPPSGIEDSPVPTEPSDFPDDSPDVDRFGDINLGSTITPAKIDKANRYKGRQSARKHVPGKGEIMPPRGLQSLYRRRKHHDRALNNHAHLTDLDMSEDESDSALYSSHGQKPSRNGKARTEPPGGLIASFLHAMNEHPNLPDVLHKWIWFVVCSFTGGTACYMAWGILNTIRGDILTANDAARAVMLAKKDACQKQYISNQCTTATAPKLIELCDEWYACIEQSTDVVYSRVFLVEISKLANDVFGVWSMRTALAAVVMLLVWVLARWATGRSSGASSATSSRAVAPPATPNLKRAPLETPRSRRQIFVEDTDTDMSPPAFAQRQLLPGRRSPTKRERSRSPVKYSRAYDMGS